MVGLVNTGLNKGYNNPKIRFNPLYNLITRLKGIRFKEEKYLG